MPTKPSKQSLNRIKSREAKAAAKLRAVQFERRRLEKALAKPPRDLGVTTLHPIPDFPLNIEIHRGQYGFSAYLVGTDGHRLPMGGTGAAKSRAGALRGALAFFRKVRRGPK